MLYSEHLSNVVRDHFSKKQSVARDSFEYSEMVVSVLHRVADWGLPSVWIPLPEKGLLWYMPWDGYTYLMTPEFPVVGEACDRVPFWMI